MASQLKSRSSAALLVVFATFVVFGLPDGVFGTLWPTQRGDLGLSIGALSWVIAGLTLGGFTGAIVSGHVTNRWGTSNGILLALAVSVVGLVGFGLAPSLVALVAVGVVAGFGAGLLDPIVNAWVSLRHGARAMGLLHAFFGVGAAIGPPLATGALSAGLTWRGVFVLLGAAELALVVAVWRRRHDFSTGADVETGSQSIAAHVQSGLLLRLTLLWFLLIVGFEVSVGAWAFSLLVEVRGVSDGAAALWVAGFWVAFTAGRFAMGAIGERLALVAALWGSVAVCFTGAALLWLNPPALPPGIALPILGAGVSLLFPVMVLLTPQWLGTARAAVATGYQFGAASVGAVGFALLIGRLADWRDLEVLGPVLVGATLAMAVILWIMVAVAGPDHRLAK